MGSVPLAGLTLRQAQARLTEAIAVYVNRPQVDVQPLEVRYKRYFLTGAFRNPGAYPILRPVTLAEAASLAGGVRDDALMDGAMLLRGGRMWPLDLAAAHMTDETPIYMTGGDLLYLPSRTEANVFVLGEVARPGSYPLYSLRGLEVMQAVAQAGGYTAAADEDELAILRRNGNRIEIQIVDLAAALRHGDVSVAAQRLRPGDIVWVPPSGLGSWNRALELITPTLDTILFKPLAGLRDSFIIYDILRR